MVIRHPSEIYQDTVLNRADLSYEELPASDITSLNGGKCSSDIPYFITGQIIDSASHFPANQFPYLFIGKNLKSRADKKASVEKHLKDGEDMPGKMFHEDWAIGIILAAIILFSLVRATTKSYLPEISRFFLFRGTREDSTRDIMGIFQWQSTILNLSSFIVIALFICFAAANYNLIPEGVPLIVVWLFSLAAIIIVVTIRHLLCIVTGSFSGEEVVFRDYLHTVYQSYRFSALLIFILLIIMSYTGFLPGLDYFITGAIFFSILYLIRVLRLFIIFINRNISIFYLILYLCALEILPVLISFKYFSGLT
jgi:hypothetical protein